MAGIGLARLGRYPKCCIVIIRLLKYNEGLKGRNVQVLDHFG